MQHIEDLIPQFSRHDFISLFLSCPNMYRVLDHVLEQFNRRSSNKFDLHTEQQHKLEKISNDLKSYLANFGEQSTESTV